jgi:hypothetical protein
MNNQNLTQFDPTNTTQWLEAKVKEYQVQVERLQAQLKHAEVLLKGHQIWLNEVKKKVGENGN